MIMSRGMSSGTVRTLESLSRSDGPAKERSDESNGQNSAMIHCSSFARVPDAKINIASPPSVLIPGHSRSGNTSKILTKYQQRQKAYLHFWRIACEGFS